jgi:PhoH-like ATPase
MTQKTYVLDTSALIFEPSVFKQFPKSQVVIPIAVLNELDKLKKLPNEAGKNARVAIRMLDEVSNTGDITTGILIDDVLLKIDATYIDTTKEPYLGFGDPSYGDTQILACLQATWHEQYDHEVILVSNDINLRIKAKARGIEAEAYEGKKIVAADLYSGVQTIIHQDAGLELLQSGFIDPRNYGLQLKLHECAIFQLQDEEKSVLGRKVAHNKIKLIKKVYPWNLSARNDEQSFLMDLILDTNIDLITAIGQAGTGKSLVAIGAALELVLNKKEYDKLIIYRPIQPMGSDIGYMPGEMSEKLAPWFQATMDSFEFLLSNKNNNNEWKRDLEMLQRRGKIELGALTYIRGRSIPNAIILIDEVQNLSTSEIKTILTRAGEGTKVILLGDIEQIDARDLDAMDNGLAYAIEKFKGSELSGHITLTQGERSRLATESAKIL